MNLLRLVWMEIWHRKLNFVISLVAIIILVGYTASILTLIRAHSQRTKHQVAALDDEIRKITKAMGFNINILPSDQNLADFHANDFGEKTMPYEYVQRLADSRDVVTINHLRPALIRKMEWPEYRRPVVLMGVSGVIPWTHRTNKKPLSEPVPPGTIVMGHDIASELQIKEGDEVQLSGETFTVSTIFERRGSKDDITVWVDLAAAQQLLQLPGRINLIQALECNCASVDRLAEIEKEISQVLGRDVQVVELSSKAIARARARVDVAAEGQRRLLSMQQRAAIHLVLLIASCSLLVGLLALMNVRERRQEIGILRALGTSTPKIMGLFLAKAVVVGVAGAAIGYAGGFLMACQLDARSADEGLQLSTAALFHTELLIGALALAPILTTLSSWIPAVIAANQDPAAILSHE